MSHARSEILLTHWPTRPILYETYRTCKSYGQGAFFMPRKQLKANAPRHKAAPERDLAVVPEESRLAVEDARKEFAHTLNRVAYGGERIILARRGRDLAAL